jgi:hypothetical protein
MPERGYKVRCNQGVSRASIHIALQPRLCTHVPRTTTIAHALSGLKSNDIHIAHCIPSFCIKTFKTKATKYSRSFSNLEIIDLIHKRNVD